MANQAFTIRTAREAGGASIGTPPETGTANSIPFTVEGAATFPNPMPPATDDPLLGPPRAVIQNEAARTPLTSIQRLASEAIGEVKP